MSKTDQFKNQYQKPYSNNSNMNINPKKRVKLSKSIIEKSRCFEPRLNMIFLPETILLKIFKKIPESSHQIRKVCTKFKRVIDNNKMSFKADLDGFSKHKFQRRINKFEKKQQEGLTNEWVFTKRTGRPNQGVSSKWESNKVRMNQIGLNQRVGSTQIMSNKSQIGPFNSQMSSNNIQTEATEPTTSEPGYFNQDISHNFNFQQNTVIKQSNAMEIKYPYSFQQNYSNYFGYNRSVFLQRRTPLWRGARMSILGAPMSKNWFYQ